MSNLRECPLCGKEVEFNMIPHYHKTAIILQQYVISCKCGLTLETRISPTAYKHDDLVQEFIDKWNHRVQTSTNITNNGVMNIEIN